MKEVEHININIIKCIFPFLVLVVGGLGGELPQDTIIITIQTVKLKTLGPDALWGGKDSKDSKEVKY